MDTPFSHKEFAKQLDLPFELLSDFNKEVSAQYGVLADAGPYKGVSQRSVFIVGRDGRVAWTWKAERGLPDVDEVLEAARRVSAG